MIRPATEVTGMSGRARAVLCVEPGELRGAWRHFVSSALLTRTCSKSETLRRTSYQASNVAVLSLTA